MSLWRLQLEHAPGQKCSEWSPRSAVHHQAGSRPKWSTTPPEQYETLIPMISSDTQSQKPMVSHGFLPWHQPNEGCFSWDPYSSAPEQAQEHGLLSLLSFSGFGRGCSGWCLDNPNHWGCWNLSWKIWRPRGQAVWGFMSHCSLCLLSCLLLFTKIYQQWFLLALNSPYVPNKSFKSPFPVGISMSGTAMVTSLPGADRNSLPHRATDVGCPCDLQIYAHGQRRLVG